MPDESLIDRMSATKAQLIPKTGYNVVAVDTFARPGSGEEIYGVQHFEDLNEAKAFQQSHQAQNPHEHVYIYGATPGGAIPEETGAGK
jgi:hypothetical protein